MTIFSSLQFISAVASYLQTSTSVGTLAVNIFTGIMPNTPVSCTAVYAQSGPITPGDPTVHPSLQILTRDSTYFASHSRAETIHNALNEKWNILTSIPGRLVAQHEVGPFFRDGNNNVVFTLNFSFTGVRGVS